MNLREAASAALAGVDAKGAPRCGRAPSPSSRSYRYATWSSVCGPFVRFSGCEISAVPTAFCTNAAGGSLLGMLAAGVAYLDFAQHATPLVLRLRSASRRSVQDDAQ